MLSSSGWRLALMVDLDIVSAKLNELAGRLSRLRQTASGSVDELTGDQDAFELVSFNLFWPFRLASISPVI